MIFYLKRFLVYGNIKSNATIDYLSSSLMVSTFAGSSIAGYKDGIGQLALFKNIQGIFNFNESLKMHECIIK